MDGSNCTATSVLTGCNLDVGSVNLYTGKVEYNLYGYNVTQWVAISFVVVYSLSMLLHLGQSLYFRIYWLLYTLFLGALCETIGWAGRLWSAQSTAWQPGLGGYWTSNRSAYMAQVCCTIIAPAFFAAADYVLLGVLIRSTKARGQRFSSFKPRGYTILFITGDIISLVVQAVGGALAAVSNDLSAANRGAYIMDEYHSSHSCHHARADDHLPSLGGICFQMAIMTAYTLVLFEFVYRYITKRPTTRSIDLVGWIPGCGSCCGGRRDKREEAEAAEVAAQRTSDSDVAAQTSKEAGPVEAGGGGGGSDALEITTRVISTRVLLAACALSTLLIFVRSVYRTIELTDGWLGPIATNQTLFNVLDALLMALAVWLFNIAHPGFFFGLSNRQRA